MIIQEHVQESEELELAERTQVLPQEVSTAQGILAQNAHVFHVHNTRHFTGIMIHLLLHLEQQLLYKFDILKLVYM